MRARLRCATRTNPDDANSTTPRNMSKKTRVDLVLVVRGNPRGREPIAAGQWYCAFLMHRSPYKNTLEGDNPTRYTVSFLQQGRWQSTESSRTTRRRSPTRELDGVLNEHRPILPEDPRPWARSVCLYLSKDNSSTCRSACWRGDYLEGGQRGCHRQPPRLCECDGQGDCGVAHTATAQGALPPALC